MTKLKDLYNRQKWTATKQRGIEFDFTFEEWCAWWELHLGPDWVRKRGCKRGQYVMARWYDDGPYAAHNVKCITVKQNNLEGMKRMWKRHYANRDTWQRSTSRPGFKKFS